MADQANEPTGGTNENLIPTTNVMHNKDARLAISTTSLDDLTKALYDYELENTVKFCVTSHKPPFNKGYGMSVS